MQGSPEVIKHLNEALRGVKEVIQGCEIKPVLPNPGV